MERPGVVLLHPLGVDHTFWRLVEARLDGLDVLSVDLPGHGQSPVPGPGVTLEVATSALADQVGRWRPGPVAVVGLSLGGIMAQVWAATRPQQVDRLVLVDTVAVYPEAMRAMWRGRSRQAPREGMAGFVEATVQAWLCDSHGEPAAEVRRMLRSADPAGYAWACAALATVDTRALVTAITAPTLVICGDDDGVVFREAAGWLAGATGTEDVVWFAGRHAAVLEDPARFTELLTGFVTDRSRAGFGRQ